MAVYTVYTMYMYIHCALYMYMYMYVCMYMHMSITIALVVPKFRGTILCYMVLLIMSRGSVYMYTVNNVHDCTHVRVHVYDHGQYMYDTLV